MNKWERVIWITLLLGTWAVVSVRFIHIDAWKDDVRFVHDILQAEIDELAKRLEEK